MGNKTINRKICQIQKNMKSAHRRLRLQLTRSWEIFPSNLEYLGRWRFFGQWTVGSAWPCTTILFAYLNYCVTIRSWNSALSGSQGYRSTGKGRYLMFRSHLENWGLKEFTIAFDNSGIEEGVNTELFPYSTRKSAAAAITAGFTSESKS